MKIANSIPYKLNFMAGKVHVYSDFDKTYCPANHSSLHVEGENSFMEKYCSDMDNFLKSTESDLHFHITTGRTFGEFEAIFYLLKMRGFRLPLPESFIAKNGSDEYIKSGNGSNFYENGIFPYKYSEPNKLKENKIKQQTNWDGVKIKYFIKSLADRYKLRFIEADSENSVKDYGSNSLFSSGKLDPDEWKKLPSRDGKIEQHKNPIADYAMGSRKDGNLKINLIFSPDYGFCSERNFIYDNFVNEIKDYLKNNNVAYSMDWEVPSKYNHYRNHCNITPKINNNALTKLYDTKAAVKAAIKSNDMVVVAGDGSNDFDMLNPLEYIENDEWNKYRKNTRCKEFYDSDMHKKLLYIREAYEGKNDVLKQELESNGLIKQIKDMPLYSVIIKKENSSLNEIKDTFERFEKIIVVENGKIEKGIKSAIKKHATNKDSFKNSMSNKFRRYILGRTKKKYYNMIIAATIALISTVAIGIFYKLKIDKRYQTYENITNTK